MKEKFNLWKKDNAGFSLLEVLVAVIILAIVAVPLLRAFAVGAQTNANARMKMKTTTATENIMEDFQYLNIDELTEKYAMVANPSGEMVLDPTRLIMTPCTIVEKDDEQYANQNVYEFNLSNTSGELNDLVKSDLPKDYTARVTLTPDKIQRKDKDGNPLTDDEGNEIPASVVGYPYANSLNVADYEPVSVRDSAIYTMDWGYDTDIYNMYLDKHTEEHDGVAETTYDEIKKKTVRELIVTINKTGYDPNLEIDLVNVSLEIKYTAPSGVVTKRETSEKFILFDNSFTKHKFDNVFLFFYPRYATATEMNKDMIKIYNNNNIECNVYLTMLSDTRVGKDETGIEKTEGVEDIALKSAYINNKALKVFVYENASAEGWSADSSAVTLRTNALKDGTKYGYKTPYSSDDDDTSYGLNFRIEYNPLLPGNESDDVKLIKKLHIGNIDGKPLDYSNIDTRIYKILVEIFDGVNDRPIAEMNGTKIM